MSFALITLCSCGGGGSSSGSSNGGEPPAVPLGLDGKSARNVDGTMGSHGGEVGQGDIAIVNVPAGALPNGTLTSIYVDPSDRMHSLFLSGTDGIVFEHVDDKAYVVRFSNAVQPEITGLRISYPVSDTLATALAGGASPVLLYYSVYSSDDPDTGEVIPEFVPLEDVQYNAGTKTISASFPANALDYGEGKLAVFHAAAFNPIANPATIPAARANPASVNLNPLFDSPLLNPLGKKPIIIDGGFGEWPSTRGHSHKGWDIRTVDGAHLTGELPVQAVQGGRIVGVKSDPCGYLELVISVPLTALRCAAKRSEILSLTLKLDDTHNVVYRHLKYSSVAQSLRAKYPDCVARIRGADDPSGLPFFDHGSAACDIKAGDVLAIAGNTGGVPPHLHIELWAPNGKGRQSQINPILAFSKVSLNNLSKGGTEIPLVATKSLAPLEGPVLTLLTSPSAVTLPAPGSPSSDVTLRVTLKDSNDVPIVIRRKKVPDSLIPIASDWTKSTDEGTWVRQSRVLGTSDDGRVVSILPPTMVLEKGVSHSQGDVVMRPLQAVPTTVTITLDYPVFAPQKEKDKWPQDDYKDSPSVDVRTLATIKVPVIGSGILTGDSYWEGSYAISTCDTVPPSAIHWYWENPCNAYLPMSADVGKFYFDDDSSEVVLEGGRIVGGIEPSYFVRNTKALGWKSASNNFSMSIPTSFKRTVPSSVLDDHGNYTSRPINGSGSRNYEFKVTNRTATTLNGTFNITMTSGYFLTGLAWAEDWRTLSTSASGTWNAIFRLSKRPTPKMNGFDFCDMSNNGLRQCSNANNESSPVWCSSGVPAGCVYE
jgi:murein DD-endopeptidase MepM/ murein hydrolase activator NlpD